MGTSWGSIAAATAGIALCTAGLRVGVGALVGPDDVPWPVGVTDERPTEPFETVSIPDEPWFLLIGSSSNYNGFDPTGLGVPVRKQSRARGYASEVAYATIWNLERTLPADRMPARILWGVNLVSFVDRKNTAVHPCAGFARTSRPSRVLDRTIDPCRGGRRWLGAGQRVARRWRRVDPWFGVRATTQDAAGVVARRLMLWEGPADPAPEEYEMLGVASRRERIFRAQAWDRVGGYEAGQLAGIHRRATAALAGAARDAGVPLTFVIMPEHSKSRGLYGPGAQEEFRSFLSEHGEVIDLFDVVPDRGFYDQGHVNELGRQAATAAMAEVLAGYDYR